MKNEKLEMTEAQAKALEVIRSRWAKVSDPYIPYKFDPYVAVTVTNEEGFSMYLGIEPDGYTHS